MNKLISIVGVAILLFTACTQNKIEVTYLKNSLEHKETVYLDFISNNGHIVSPYIMSVKFGYLGSISFLDGKPDNMESHISYQSLDFTKPIETYSPEYYAAYTIYNIHKTITYFNLLFDDKIDFNSQKEYMDIEIVFGNTPLLTTPKTYCFEEKSIMSPSLFSHEIGHRAFWYLESEAGLGVKFGGLTIVHMGLLEYFNMSLNNSPIEVEESLSYPNLFRRDARNNYIYPMDSTYTLRYTFKNLERVYADQLTNPQSNMSKYLAACYNTYNDYILDNYYDNHYGGMILAGTLWRIREKIGQTATDKLVAQMILELNEYLKMREDYYIGDKNILSKGADWSDVLFGMIYKDKEYYNGKNISIIVDEFSKTGYPVQNIRFDNVSNKL